MSAAGALASWPDHLTDPGVGSLTTHARARRGDCRGAARRSMSRIVENIRGYSPGALAWVPARRVYAGRDPSRAGRGPPSRGEDQGNAPSYWPFPRYCHWPERVRKPSGRSKGARECRAPACCGCGRSIAVRKHAAHRTLLPPTRLVHEGALGCYSTSMVRGRRGRVKDVRPLRPGGSRVPDLCLEARGWRPQVATAVQAPRSRGG
jgi:hypothetical protein